MLVSKQFMVPIALFPCDGSQWGLTTVWFFKILQYKKKNYTDLERHKGD